MDLSLHDLTNSFRLRCWLLFGLILGAGTVQAAEIGPQVNGLQIKFPITNHYQAARGGTFYQLLLDGGEVYFNHNNTTDKDKQLDRVSLYEYLKKQYTIWTITDEVERDISKAEEHYNTIQFLLEAYKQQYSPIEVVEVLPSLFLQESPATLITRPKPYCAKRIGALKDDLGKALAKGEHYCHQLKAAESVRSCTTIVDRFYTLFTLSTTLDCIFTTTLYNNQVLPSLPIKILMISYINTPFVRDNSPLIVWEKIRRKTGHEICALGAQIFCNMVVFKFMNRSPLLLLNLYTFTHVYSLYKEAEARQREVNLPYDDVLAYQMEKLADIKCWEQDHQQFESTKTALATLLGGYKVDGEEIPEEVITIIMAFTYLARDTSPRLREGLCFREWSQDRLILLLYNTFVLGSVYGLCTFYLLFTSS